MTTVADVIAGALARHGVETILGQSNPTELMLATERIGIRQILYRTENAGGAMADGFARISGRIGVVAAQNGPAATLLVVPMGEALKASVPMLVLVQEVWRPTATATRSRRWTTSRCSRASRSGPGASTTRACGGRRRPRAHGGQQRTARAGRPARPRDVLGLPAVPARFPRTADLGAFPLDRPRPDAAEVARAARLLAAARSPLVVAGGGVHGSGAVAELAALQEAAHLPVVTTNMGKGAVDESGPLSLGVAANVTGERGPARFHLDLIGGADVVLLVGTRTNENGTEGWTLTSPTPPTSTSTSTRSKWDGTTSPSACSATPAPRSATSRPPWRTPTSTPAGPGRRS